MDWKEVRDAALSKIDPLQAEVDSLHEQLGQVLLQMQPLKEQERQIRAAIKEKNESLAPLKFKLGDIVRTKDIKDEKIRAATLKAISDQI